MAAQRATPQQSAWLRENLTVWKARSPVLVLLTIPLCTPSPSSQIGRKTQSKIMRMPTRWKDLIRCFLPADITASSTDFAFGASQEYLLGTLSVERKGSLSDNESDSGHASLKDHGEGALPRLPKDLVLRISEVLDEVSLLCFKNTNRYLREIITINETQISQCARWRMLTFLEADLVARDKSYALLRHLACMYCKRAHPKEDFGVPDGNVGYGVERLYLIHACEPDARFCWRYIPKLLNYTPGIENLDGRGQKLLTDKWVCEYRKMCYHCGNRLVSDETDKLVCQFCAEECEICKIWALPNFERHGPQRPLESYAGIRFVRRTKKDYRLEIRDLNGIRDPQKPLPSEPKIWREWGRWVEIFQEYMAVECLVHKFIISRNRFSLYSPVDNSKSLFRCRPGRR